MRFFLFQGLCTLFFDRSKCVENGLLHDCKRKSSNSNSNSNTIEPPTKWTIEKWEFENMLTLCLHFTSTSVSPVFRGSIFSLISFFFVSARRINMYRRMHICMFTHWIWISNLNKYWSFHNFYAMRKSFGLLWSHHDALNSI